MGAADVMDSLALPLGNDMDQSQVPLEDYDVSDLVRRSMDAGIRRQSMRRGTWESVLAMSLPGLDEDSDIPFNLDIGGVSEMEEGAGQAGPAAGTQQQQALQIGLDQFDFVKIIGTGTFGRVALAKYKQDGSFCAVKILEKDFVVKSKQVEHTLSEKQILLGCQNQFVVRLMASFKDNANLFMVLEYVPGGELFYHLRTAKVFPEPTIAFYAIEIGVAVEYAPPCPASHRPPAPPPAPFLHSSVVAVLARTQALVSTLAPRVHQRVHVLVVQTCTGAVWPPIPH